VTGAGRGHRQGTARSVSPALRAALETTNVSLEGTAFCPTTVIILPTNCLRSCVQGEVSVRDGAREVVIMRSTVDSDSLMAGMGWIANGLYFMIFTE
jgi:hypothetical protein